MELSIENVPAEVRERLNDRNRLHLEMLCSIMGQQIYNLQISWKKIDIFEKATNVVLRVNGLSTFDFSELTRMVVLAHDNGVRVSIFPKSHTYMEMRFDDRITYDDFEMKGDKLPMHKRHPSLKGAIRMVRDPYPKPTHWRVNRLRAEMDELTKEDRDIIREEGWKPEPSEKVIEEARARIESTRKAFQSTLDYKGAEFLDNYETLIAKIRWHILPLLRPIFDKFTKGKQK